MKKYLFIYLLLIGIAVASCKKEEPEPEQITNPTPAPTPVFAFSSLSAENTTIPIGGTAKITASASGENLTYSWSASQGDILGSGSQITYGASNCCAGENEITCTVKDGNNNSDTKKITITVQ